VADLSAAIKIEGYSELRMTFLSLSPALNEELRVGLKAIGDMVAQTAEEVAAFQGFDPPGRSGRGSGALIGGIRSGVTKHKAYVKTTARRGDYAYPRIYEYGNSRERAFLHPAIDLNRDKIYATFIAVLDNIKALWDSGVR
jgi:hypothetical protein